ncbi:MAG: prepilin-type N-terminal cleavage/methylation domain-containing protein [Demequinaceae bacterium]|nr:prepilin-type N-terminal cleavage/methylation domain-containing protein [Demequinaceae bacterium]
MTATLARAKRRVAAKRGDAGFSMVELVVAMMILGVILVLLAAVQISSIVTVTEARKLQQATAFANEAVEQMHSIPWNTLSKGMYSGYLGASGGDELVSSGVLTVDGKSVNLIVAPASNDQNLANPARPLFDTTGSHVQVRTDPSLTGVEFTIKAYVTEAAAGFTDGSVGIAVVVEWQNRHGGVSRTTVWSEAYRGSVTSCGNADTQPFLAACQSFLQATSDSGTVTAEISATNVDPDPASIFAIPLMYPSAAVEYSLGWRSANAAASITSQQVNFADGIVQFGGNTVDDNIATTPALQQGLTLYTLRATDDVTNQSGWVLNPADLAVTQSSAVEAETYVYQTGVSPVKHLRTRSDYGRPATVDASMTVSCLSGIPAGQPCAYASIDNEDELLDGSGYILMTMDDDTIIRLTRRRNELASGPYIGNTDEAWAARFVSATGSVDVGCETISGAGCVSAGASRTMADLNLGTVISGSWDGAATAGMVVLKGDPGNCDYYTESVMVQRGADQKTTTPDYDRCGRLEYWNGTGYSAIVITENTSTTIDTAPVTWTNGDTVMTATTQVQILPAYVNNPAPTDPDCKTDACTVSVSAGTIVMVSTYDLVWPSHEFVLIVSTIVTSPFAQASYTAAPHVS